jgi:hypothetical protein
MKQERRAEELARYCREVDLVAFAFSFGYRRREGADAGEGLPAGAVVLRHPANLDQLVVWRDGDGVWRYSSTADGVQGQTVVEFLLRRRRLGLGYVRRDLRWWLREHSPRGRPPSPR